MEQEAEQKNLSKWTPDAEGKNSVQKFLGCVQFTIRTTQLIKEPMIILHNKNIDDSEEDGNGDTDI